MRSSSWVALLGFSGILVGCSDASPTPKRRPVDHGGSDVIVAADRFTPRVDDRALASHVDAAPTLDDALAWTVPRMGDEFAADRMFAARDVPRNGGALLERWADRRLRFEVLEARAEPLDLGRALFDAAPLRGTVACLRGDVSVIDPHAPREAVLVPRDDAAELDTRVQHAVHLASEIPRETRDVRFCGVLVGRRIVPASEPPGLLFVGVAKAEARPDRPDRSLGDVFDELIQETPEPPPRTWSL